MTHDTRSVKVIEQVQNVCVQAAIRTVRSAPFIFFWIDDL
jgi:hypothetical protein